MVTTAEKSRRKAQSRRAKQDDDRRSARIFNKVWKEWQPKLFPVKPEEQAAPALASATEISQARFLSSWFNNQNYSDATIYIHGVKLYAHKLVICGKCQYFANAFDKFKEGEQGFIEFNQGSAVAYFRVFQYLYTGDYSADWEAQGLEDDLDLLKDPRVYFLADMFLMEDLKAFSLAKLQARLQIGSRSQIPGLFPECVREIYSNTSSSSPLRQEVIRCVAAHTDLLRDNESYLELLHGGGEFVVDLMKER